ncbi:pilus assembly protein PilS [Neisseria gonorrhoeae]
MASSFPRRRESGSVGTETYRENGFFRFYVPDSRFRGNDGICLTAFVWKRGRYPQFLMFSS